MNDQELANQKDTQIKRDRLDVFLSMVNVLATLSCLVASVAAMHMGQMDHAIYFALLTLISEKAGKS